MIAAKPLIGRIWRALDAHPARSVLIVGALVTLALVNVRLFAGGGPWWRGWADQKAYLESARAFLALDLDPARHWYPLLYPLTGAPFAGILAAPFVPANIACFALAFLGFRKVCARLGVSGAGAVLLWLAAALLDPRIARLWVEPWTTTLSAALIWLSLGMVADHLAGDRPTPRRAALLGALLAAIPLARPTDLAVAAIIAPFALWRLPLRAFITLAGAALAVFAAYLALHLAIYGARWSDYVLLSREYGLNFADLPWKAYVLLVDPQPWFPGETGLLREMPWLLFGAAGLILGGFRLRGPARALWLCLAAAALAYCVILFAYVDLLPSGMWRFNNIHYFKWLLPLFALASLLLIRWAHEMPRCTAAVLAALVLLSCVRPQAVLVGPAEPARALRFAAPAVPWAELYMARSGILDARGAWRNYFDYHQIPDGQETFVAVALKGRFAGEEMWMPSGVNDWPLSGAPGRTPHFADPYPRRPVERWGTRVVFGGPCWIVRCG